MARQPRKPQGNRLTADQMRQILDQFGPQMPPAVRQQIQRQMGYSQANPSRPIGTAGTGDVPRVVGGNGSQRTSVERARNYEPTQRQLNQEAAQIMPGMPNPKLQMGNASAFRPESLPAGPRAEVARRAQENRARMAQANQMEAPPVSLEANAGASNGFFDVPGQAPPAAGSVPPQLGFGPMIPGIGATALGGGIQGLGPIVVAPATGAAYQGGAYSGPGVGYQPFGPQAGQAPTQGSRPPATAPANGGDGAGQGPAEQAAPEASGQMPASTAPKGWESPTYAGPQPVGQMPASTAPPGWESSPMEPQYAGDQFGGGEFMGGQASTAPEGWESPTYAGPWTPPPLLDYAMNQPAGWELPPSENPYGGGPMMGGQGGGLPQAGGGGGSWPSLSGSPGDGGTRPGVPGAPAQTGLGQAVGGQQADTGDAGGADGGEAGSGDGFDAAAAYEAMQQAWKPAQSYARPTAGFVPGSPAPGLGQGTTTGLGPPMGMGGGAGMGGPVAPDQMMSPEQQQAAQQFLQGTFDQFQGAQDAANAANEARYQQGLDLLSGLNAQQNQMLGGLGGLYGQRTNQYAQGAEAAMNRYNDPFSFWTSASANVGRGYDALNQDVMNRTGLMGATEAENIRQRFGQQQAQAEQDLINRGLGNTTIRPAVQRGINYDQSRAQTGLAEDVANQMNQLDIGTRMPLLQFGAQSSQFGAGLLGNQAQAAERFIGNIANLQGEGLQFGERANQAQQGIGQTTLGWLGSRNDTGPDYNTMAGLASQIAAGGVGWGNIPSLPAPSTPSQPQAPNLPYMPPTQQQRPPSSLTPTTRPQARPAAPSRQQPWATIL